MVLHHAEFETAAVASDSRHCSAVGKDVLQRGGSVVDAAIATMLCVGLHHSHSAGIGGGTMMVLYDAPTGKSFYMNSRSVAPFDVHKIKYNSRREIRTGAIGICVPGEVAGFWMIHKKFGKLPWKDLFDPAIKMAEDGFVVGSALANALRKYAHYVTEKPNFLPIFLREDGMVKREGDIVKNIPLADTLRHIAQNGGPAFYKGELARCIVADIKDELDKPSPITVADLEAYGPEFRPLIRIPLDDKLTLLTPSNPSGGPVLCCILNILKGYKFKSDTMDGTEAKILTYHRILEAKKFANARRKLLGDDHFDARVNELVEHMISEDFAEEARQKIDDKTTRPKSFYDIDGGVCPPDDNGTSHLCIVGEDGSAIAMTSTINDYFGGFVRGRRTGIIFNNELRNFTCPNDDSHMDSKSEDFLAAISMDPEVVADELEEIRKSKEASDNSKVSSSNLIEPRKRPLSSMAPTIIIDKNACGLDAVKLVIGGSGGQKITSAVALSIMNHLWFDQPIYKAVAARRIHCRAKANTVFWEVGFDQDVLEGIRKKNHKVAPNPYPMPGSVVQAISRSPGGTLVAVSDWRKGGHPDGYSRKRKKSQENGFPIQNGKDGSNSIANHSLVHLIEAEISS